MFCDLGMRDIRDSRHSLLIEKCRQLDPQKLQDPDKMRWVGKMIVKVEHVVTMRDIHFLGPSVKRGLSPDKQVSRLTRRFSNAQSEHWIFEMRPLTHTHRVMFMFSQPNTRT